MDNLLTYSNFKGQFYLPVEADSSNEENLNDIIEYQQQSILKLLLGDVLYAEFNAAIIAGSPDQKWIDLRDGANFTNDDGIIIEFKGVTDMLIGFIYFYYVRSILSSTATTGEVKAENLNSTVVANNQKLAYAWNMAADKYGVDYRNDFTKYQTIQLIAKPYDLSGIRQCKGGAYLNANILKLQPSAYNFLTANISDYNNWIFRNIGYVNNLGI